MPADSAPSNTRHGQDAELAHDQLRDAILRGTIPAGERSQVTLARELGVGRTPLREALRMLQREGLVIAEPNRRVRIAELSAADAEELYVMRIALESVAVRMTVPSLGSQGIAQLKGHMAEMDHYMRSYDRTGMRASHHALHAELVAGAGERVALTISQLFDHAERYRLAFGATTPEIWSQRRSEHNAIVEAAASGDAELAATRLIEHYGRTAALIFSGLGGDYEPVRLRLTIASLAPGAEDSLGT